MIGNTPHPPSDPPRLPPPRSGFATNRDGRGTSPYRITGRAAVSAAGGGVKRSSLRRVFVGEGGDALSRDNRRSKARTRSATPGELGGLPACSATKPAAATSDGGDDDSDGWMNSSGGLPATDLSGDCTIDDSTEAETEELAVRVEWYDGSPRTSNARKGGPLPLPEPPPPTPNSLSRPVRGACCESSVPSRCTMSIVPSNRSSVSVLAVCRDDADRPWIVS
jgi:hypothetical protein